MARNLARRSGAELGARESGKSASSSSPIASPSAAIAVGGMAMGAADRLGDDPVDHPQLLADLRR